LLSVLSLFPGGTLPPRPDKHHQAQSLLSPPLTPRAGVPVATLEDLSIGDSAIAPELAALLHNNNNNNNNNNSSSNNSINSQQTTTTPSPPQALHRTTSNCSSTGADTGTPLRRLSLAETDTPLHWEALGIPLPLIDQQHFVLEPYLPIQRVCSNTAST
jgi:hypothetical protein